MFFSFITLRYNTDTGRINDDRFQEFAKGKEVLSVREHFYMFREIPHLTLCVSWRMPEAGSAKKNSKDNDWRSHLKTPQDEELFDRIRRWRADKSKKEGVPAYAVMTNKQLGELVSIKPKSKAALGTINGFGPARIDRYGEEILKIAGVK